MVKIVNTSQEIYEDLQQTCVNLFNLNFTNPKPLQLGWLNLKWKVESEEGEFVLKQFSKERWKRFNRDQVVQEQKLALMEQQRQYTMGTPCPRLLKHNNEVMHTTLGGERFIVMEYLPGENLPAGKFNEEQMYSLGKTAARMHEIANDGTHGRCETTKFSPPSREERVAYWECQKESEALRTKTEQEQQTILSLIEKQQEATRKLDTALFKDCEPGWAHRDLWNDNILFAGSEVSAVLDFDRFAYDYPELDIARAVMSGALDADGLHLNLGAAAAFLEGYHSGRSLAKGTLLRSLYLLWTLESVWWIGAEMDLERSQTNRFAREMSWLAEHFSELPLLIGEL